MRYILFTKRDCPFCKSAIELLVSKKLEHEVVDLQDSLEILESFKKIYRWATVPMIFVENKKDMNRLSNYELLGGFEDLKNHLNRE